MKLNIPFSSVNNPRARNQYHRLQMGVCEEDNELVGSSEKGKRKRKTPLAPRWGLHEGEEEDDELVGSFKTRNRQTPLTLGEGEEKLVGPSKKGKRNKQTPLCQHWINFSPQ